MAGSMREKRPGVWELRVYVGRDRAGQVRHRHASFNGGKRAAQRELGRLVAQYGGRAADDVGLIEPASPEWGSKTTVNDAIEGWRKNGWEDLSPSTTRRYRSLYEVHIRDGIGRRRIAALGPYEVERFFRELKKKGQSESSVRQARAMLHRACKLARKWSNNQLPNPVADTELPEWRIDEKGPVVRSPEAQEVRAILDAAWREDVRVAVFIRLVAATGARRGEIAAVRWSDVGWDEQSIRIDEGIVSDVGRAVVKSPKTRASVRSVAVDGDSMDQLAVLREERENIAGACGVELDGHGFVFATDPSGREPPHPDSMTTAFSRLRRIAGVPSDIHLHSLRHFQSTVLDPIVSEAQKQARLGWATVHMARHYTDAITEEDRKAASHVGVLLGAPADATAEPRRRSAVRFRREAAVS